MSTITINEIPVVDIMFLENADGPWVGIVTTAGDGDELANGVTLVLGSRTLHGTVTYVVNTPGARVYHLLGGGGGWHKKLAAEGFSSGSAVDPVGVLQLICRSAGESLAGGERLATLGAHFAIAGGDTFADVVRRIARIAGGVPRITDSGELTFSARTPRTVEALVDARSFDVRVIALTDATQSPLGALQPGDTVRTPDGVTYFVGAVEVNTRRGVHITTIRDATYQTPADALTDPHRTARRLDGLYEYEVQSASGGTANLLATHRADVELSALSDVPVCPGIPGATATLAQGAKVYVQFVNGSPDLPRVTNFAAGSVSKLEIDADQIVLGGGTAAIAVVGTKIQITPDATAGMLTAPNGPVTQSGIIMGTIVASGASQKGMA